MQESSSETLKDHAEKVISSLSLNLKEKPEDWDEQSSYLSQIKNSQFGVYSAEMFIPEALVSDYRH